MNATFNFYSTPSPYQPLPSAPPHVEVPVKVPYAIPVETDKGYKKIIGVFICFGVVVLGVYLLTYWANHVTA